MNRYQVAQKIAAVANCDIQKNKKTYALYDKSNGGWRGCITENWDFQGIAADKDTLIKAGLNPAEPSMQLT